MTNEIASPPVRNDRKGINRQLKQAVAVVVGESKISSFAMTEWANSFERMQINCLSKYSEYSII